MRVAVITYMMNGKILKKEEKKNESIYIFSNNHKYDK